MPLLDAPPRQKHLRDNADADAAPGAAHTPRRPEPIAPPVPVAPKADAVAAHLSALAEILSKTGNPEEIADLRARIDEVDGSLGSLGDAIGDRFTALESAVAASSPVRIELAIEDRDPITLPDDTRPEVADIIAGTFAGFANWWLAGPAGSGKSTIAKTVADALARPLSAQSFAADVSSAALIGTLDAHGAYRDTAFVTAWESGHVILLDELDAAPAEIVVTLNDALANGVLNLPRNPDPARRRIVRHADTIVVAAANTWGHGPDAQYVGRAALDAATLDRFVGATLYIGYDPVLEAAIVGDERSLRAARADRKKHLDAPRPPAATADEVADLLRKMRAAVANHRLRRVVSTRAYLAADRLRRLKSSPSEIANRLMAGWTADERAKVGA